MCSDTIGGRGRMLRDVFMQIPYYSLLSHIITKHTIIAISEIIIVTAKRTYLPLVMISYNFTSFFAETNTCDKYQ